MDKATRNKNVKRGAAVTGVAAVAALALLFGSGKLGFGSGVGLGDPAAAPQDREEAVVASAAESASERASETEAARDDRIEIRIQGRGYNYGNVSYGGNEHSLEELLDKLKELPRDSRIELAVEDDATKNAVDELEQALRAAGFTDIHK